MKTYLIITLVFLFNFLYSQNNAQFISQTSVPSELEPGEQFTVSITMKNTGTTTWISTGTNQFKLGSQNPQDNNNWGVGGRLYLSTDVVPNEEYTFTQTFTAPSTNGVYNFQWKMLKEGIAWFGDVTTNAEILVSNYSLVGTTIPTSNKCYQLTDTAADCGAIWYKEKIDLRNTFDINFTLDIQNLKNNGADGMMFVLQNESDSAIGTAGGSLGYNGIGTKSMGVEFDVYNNRKSCGLGDWPNDPPYDSWNGPEPADCSDHIAISRNGNVLCEIASPISMFTDPSQTIEDDTIHHQVRIKWDPNTDSIHVYLDCVLRIAVTYDIINDIFQGENLVYWGFTGSTGPWDYDKIEVCLDGNIFTALEDKTICKGNSVQINVQGATYGNPTWTPNYNIDSLHSYHPIVNPDSSITYYLSYQHPKCLDYRTDSVRINVNEPTATISGGGEICDDGSTTDIIMDFTGGADWTYNWSVNGTSLPQGTTNNSHIIFPLSEEGVYIFTSVTDSLGCPAIIHNDTAIIIVNPLPTPNITGNLEFCDGNYTSLDAGFYPGYLWSTTETSQTINITTAGQYTVTVTDDNSCSNSDTVNVIMHNNPIVNTIVTPSSTICYGDTILIDASNSTGVSTLTYEWSNNTNNDNINVWPTSSLSYYITVTDINNCFDIDTIDVTVNSLPIANAGNVNPTICYGETVLLNASNSQPGTGNSSLTYEWSNNATTDTTSVSPSNDDIYIVTVTNESSCKSSDTIEVFVNQLPVINLTPNNNSEICNNDSILIDASTSTGSGTLVYEWSTLSDSANTNVWPTTDSTFYITVTDGNHCSNYSNITIIVNQLPTFGSPTITPVTDCVNPNGEITVVGQGEHPSFQYNINSGAFSTNSTFTNLQGAPTFGIIDSKGCKFDTIFIIPNTSGLSVDTIIFDEILCNGDSTSTVSILATGSGSDIHYSMDGGNTTQVDSFFTNVGAGIYPISIVDNTTSCIASKVLEITEPDALTNHFTKYDVSCYGDNSGSAVANYAGGTLPYTSISGNFSLSSDSIFNLYSDTIYTIQIIDNNGCTLNDSFLISQPNELIISTISKSNLQCNNDFSGSVIIGAIGGTYPITYSWGNNITVNDSIINNLAAGMYYFYVTDGNGCSKNDSIEVTQPDTLLISILTQNTICDTSNGIAIATTTGGTPEYSYTWNNASINSDSLGGLPAGNYSVIVTDNHNCKDSINFEINDQSTGNISINNIKNVNCFGDSTANIYASINGGTSSYIYNWYNNNSLLLASDTSSANTNSIHNIPEGFYSLQIIDSMNCVTSIDSIYVNQNSQIHLIYQKTDILCYNDTNGSILVNVTGGVTPYSYLWNNNDTTSVTNNLMSGYYAILVTDSLNCRLYKDSIKLTNPTKLTFDTIATQNLSCFESNNGEIEFDVNGGTGNYNYFIDSIQIYSTNLNTISAGKHFIHAIDENNCIIRDTFFLTQPDLLAINDSINENNIFVQANGGTPEYYYNWDNGETTQLLTKLPSGTYTITVTDKNNCITIDTFIIEEPLLIPTVITPNADNINDTWNIKGLLAFKKITINIFNRWGDNIFSFEGSGIEYNDKSKQWDGIYKGKELPLGTYVYILEIDGITNKYNGTITILR